MVRRRKRTKIRFNDSGAKLVSVDRRFLKKHPEGGFFIKDRGLIHFFDKRKRFERSKFL